MGTEGHDELQVDRPNLLIGTASPSAPIIGRERELVLLMDHYEAVKSGHAHVMLLTGEPGIGKTRLLDEVASLTARDGAIVLRGSASNAEGMPPFLPFLEAIGRYIRCTSQEQLRAQITAIPQTLADLLPELAVCLPDLLTSLPVPPEQSRLRLYEAIGTFLEAISAFHTLVITLDNLHWADTASLDLLRHLTHYQSRAQLLILGAYREGEVDRNQALASTLTELSHQRVLTTITVSPLSVEEIRMLAASRRGKYPSPGVNMLLYTQSEGNPFFAEELLEGWIESGVIKLVNDQWVASEPLTHMLPPTIVSALRQRFMHLRPVVIDHLRIASIIGRSFDLALLAMVEEQEIEAVEECLTEASQAQLIRTDPQGRYFFSHDKIRECLYSEVSSTRRRRLHELIGRAIEAQAGQERSMSTRQLADLAFHFAHSNDRQQGIRYALIAAKQAKQATAFEEAISHYRTAIELLGLDDGRRGMVLLDLGEASLLAGKDQEAETIYNAAQNWFLQFKQDDVAQIAKASHGSGLALWRQEKRHEAYEAFIYALTFYGDSECVERVKILIDLSHLLMIYMGNHDGGLAYAQQAQEIAHRLGETELEETARRISIGNLLIHGTDLPLAVQALEQMMAYIEKLADPAEVCECCLNLAVGYYWSGEIRRSHEVSLRRIALIERCRQPYQLRTAYTWPVLLLASQGKWMEAERAIERARPVVEHLDSPMPYAFLHQFQGFLAFQRENYQLAAYEFEAAWTLVGQHLQCGLGEMMFYFGFTGLVQIMLGKHEEAITSEAYLERILSILPDEILPTAPMRVCLALSSIALNDHKRAKDLYMHLLAFSGQHYWFLVDRILGQLATMSGEWETAATHLAAAEATARREGLIPELARTLQGQAAVASGRGGSEGEAHAIDLLHKALALFEDLSMQTSAEHVRQKLQSLAHQPQHPAQNILPANLTQRETDVLRLVTRGKSNSQIAQELVISEKTVANHLTRIFYKTNSENRTAATVFAIRHNLV